jgi:hypothetical protein
MIAGFLMTSSLFLMLSGIALAAGGVSATLGWLLFAFFDPRHEDYSGKLWLPLNFMIILGGLGMSLGLPGFYASQSNEAGSIGLVGFVLLFTGLVIPYIAVHSIETVTIPDIPQRMRLMVSIGAPSLFLGTILTGIAIWRVGLYPTWLAIYLAAAALVGLLTTLLPVPQWLYRNISPIFTTSAISMMGILLISQ